MNQQKHIPIHLLDKENTMLQNIYINTSKRPDLHQCPK